MFYHLLIHTARDHKSYLGGCVGAVLVLAGKGIKVVEFVPVGFNIETGEGHEYLLLIGFGVFSSNI